MSSRTAAAILLLAFALILSACTPHVYGDVNVRGPFVDLEHVSIDSDIPLGGRVL